MADHDIEHPDLLRAGAERFSALLHLMHAETERQFSERREDAEAGIDVFDYQLLARMIEEQLPHCLVMREGFMRSMADVLCICIDGCGISSLEEQDRRIERYWDEKEFEGRAATVSNVLAFKLPEGRGSHG